MEGKLFYFHSQFHKTSLERVIDLRYLYLIFKRFNKSAVEEFGGFVQSKNCE